MIPCKIQQVNLSSSSSGRTLKMGAYVTTFRYIWNHATEHHTRKKYLSKHPGNYVLLHHCAHPLFRCLNVILFLCLSLEPWCRDWDLIYILIYLFILIMSVVVLREKDHCLALKTGGKCYFCWCCSPPPTVVGHGSLSEATAGDWCHS